MTKTTERLIDYLRAYHEASAALGQGGPDLGACDNGHLHCSIRDGGPCFDEVCSTLESRGVNLDTI